MTDDLDRDEEQTRLRITDRRRFANLSEEAVPAGGGAGGTASGPEPAQAAETAPDPGAGAGGQTGADLEELRAEAQQYLDHLRRLQAEFDNYRKRTAKEQAELAELGAMPLARRLLEVLDDFELALLSAGEQPDFDRFLKGVELVYAKLLEAVGAEGLERMQAEGRPFDPALHEALLQTGEGQGDPVVADVLRPGYTLKGRVLRPAGVRVERAE